MWNVGGEMWDVGYNSKADGGRAKRVWGSGKLEEGKGGRELYHLTGRKTRGIRARIETDKRQIWQNDRTRGAWPGRTPTLK
jgi:hypothetical protein